MQLLDTLADKRQLVRVPFAGAAQLSAGQYLHCGATRLPLLRHDATRATVDIVIASNTQMDYASLQVTGQSLALENLPGHCLITHNDGLFRALHALFLLPSPQRKLISVIAQFDHALPFSPCPSRSYSAQLPGHVIAALPLLEDWGVFNRLVHAQAPGCFDGDSSELIPHFPFADKTLVLD